MELFEVFNGELKKYHGDEQEVVIPETITSIADYAFYGCDNLEKVTFHKGIYYVGSYVFYECRNLKEVIFNDNLRSIANGVFASCKALEYIKLPDSLTSISKSMFHKCDILKEVILPSKLKHIEHDAFAYCYELKDLVFPDTLETIGDSAFEECTSLKHIIIPSSIKHIGKKAFFHTMNISTIELKADECKIEDGAFQTHSNLQFITETKMLLRPIMFDFNWNLNWQYSFRQKNGDNYVLHDSNFPNVRLREWKPVARVVLIINYLETYKEDNEEYIHWLNELKKETLEFMVREKRFNALNTATSQGFITQEEVEPYFDLINDQEEKAKLLEINHQKDNKSLLDQLEADFDDLF